jgi:iron complex outermembrane receptor protein
VNTFDFKARGFASLACITLTASLGAGEPAINKGDETLAELGKIDLATLLNIEVTSASKKEQRLSETAAAIYVITQEDIRKSGFTTLPEVFRMVPGMQVARVNANQWAITSRGFNDSVANKLLVMVDGRTIYTPSFGGVFWSDHDLMLENLDRIEVIRGPGATMWGANAFNGVINIISKSAKETQGLLMSTSYGTLEQPVTNVRYGGEIKENIHYRVYGRYLNYGDFENEAGASLGDDWRSGSGGFRLDWKASDTDQFTLQGDYRRLKVGDITQRPVLTPPYAVEVAADDHNTSANILGRWTHQFAEGNEFSLQAYYDRYEHGELGSKTRENTFDIDLKHQFTIGERNEIIWGGGYRYLPGELIHPGQIRWSKAESHHQLANVFVQDEIGIIPEKLLFTLGSKFEHNDFTGLEMQPSARLAYHITEDSTVWGAASRAVRIPTLIDTRFEVDLGVVPPNGGNPPALVQVRGTPEMGVEEVFSYELGYRVHPHKRLSVDAAGFFNVFDDLRAWEEQAPQFSGAPVPHVIAATEAANAKTGYSYGAEVAADWAVTDRWRLHASYTWVNLDIRWPGPESTGTPEQQVQLRSYLELPQNIELIGAAYFVDQIMPSGGVMDVAIESYMRLDVGVTWRPYPNLEVGVWGQNLTDSGHPEFTSYRTQEVAEIPRSVVGRVTWSY